MRNLAAMFGRRRHRAPRPPASGKKDKPCVCCLSFQISGSNVRRQPDRKVRHARPSSHVITTSARRSLKNARRGTRKIATSTAHEGVVPPVPFFFVVGLNKDDLEKQEGDLPKDIRVQPRSKINTVDESSSDSEVDSSDGEDYDEMEGFLKDLPPSVGSDKVTLRPKWVPTGSRFEFTAICTSFSPGDSV